MGLIISVKIRDFFDRLFPKHKEPVPILEPASPDTSAVLDLMNFTNQSVQYFSFPTPLIKCIFDNSKIISTQKLIKCCKYFKFLQFKRNQIQIDLLESYPNMCDIAAGLSKKRVEYFPNRCCQYRFKSMMKSIKVFDTFMFSYRICDCFFSFIEKFDLSETKKIDISVPFLLEQNVLEKILNSSLEELTLFCRPNENLNPALLAFQRCPKMKELVVYYNLKGSPIPLINENIFKRILKTKREIKFHEISLKPVLKINEEDFIDFLENYMAPNSLFLIETSWAEAFYKLNEMLERIQTTTHRNKNDAIRILLWWSNHHIEKYW